ncbi:MAG: metallophosphoesterase [Sphingomonas sp.]|uniref:metallophosphoesterase n=1 Tax=Sphingomonas sp. TaxID=28214 RepID=UPI0025D96E90|nr:metallophosphoesterase [Sphingomonas sp.]MBX3565711.1 metallophosphoesterase [Sphingomonas sp.]
MKRFLLLVLGLAVAAAAALAGYAYLEARRDPVVREASISLPGWPAGAAPMRVVLISDIHIGTAAMGPERLTRIVTQINALEPDLVLIAGDFIFGHGAGSAARIGPPLVAPLAGLKARYGVVAALGNHDHWTGAAEVRALLQRANVTVVENGAVQRGPLALGVAGDDFSHHTDLLATVSAMRPLSGARIMLTHSPDIAPNLPADVALLLAGHTHCGQVVLPFYGPISDVSRFGERYRCGVRREPGRTVVTTAGLGTSGGPFRLGAPPDLWLLTLGK